MWWDLVAAAVGRDRRAVHRPHARHRRALGPPDLGHLLGLGRSPHDDGPPLPDASSATSPCAACRPTATPGNQRSAVVGHRSAPSTCPSSTSPSTGGAASTRAPPSATLDVKIDGLMLFTLFLGLVAFGLLYAWLLIHRFRLAVARGPGRGDRARPGHRRAPRRSRGGECLMDYAGLRPRRLGRRRRRHRRATRRGSCAAARRVAEQVPAGPPALERLVTSALDDVDDPGAGHGHDERRRRRARPHAADLGPDGRRDRRRRHRSAPEPGGVARPRCHRRRHRLRRRSRASATPPSTSATPTRRSPSATTSAPAASASRASSCDDVRERGRRGHASPSPSTAPTSRCVHRGDPPDLFRPGHPGRARGPLRRGRRRLRAATASS